MDRKDWSVIERRVVRELTAQESNKTNKELARALLPVYLDWQERQVNDRG